jgi:hypothetical protein
MRNTKARPSLRRLSMIGHDYGGEDSFTFAQSSRQQLRWNWLRQVNAVFQGIPEPLQGLGASPNGNQPELQPIWIVGPSRNRELARNAGIQSYS